MLLALLVSVALIALVLFGNFTPNPEKQISIEEIKYKGKDEYIMLVNRGNQDVDLSGWRIRSGSVTGGLAEQQFIFPEGCMLPAGGILRLHSGPMAKAAIEEGQNNPSCKATMAANGRSEVDLYDGWANMLGAPLGAGREIWSDAGDTAELLNQRRNLIDKCVYTAEDITRETNTHRCRL